MRKMKLMGIALCVLLIAPVFSGDKSKNLPFTQEDWFSDVTDEVGLEGVCAFRISIADVNGDDYPDLLIHRRGNERGLQSLYLNVPGDNLSDPYARKFIDFTEVSGITANRDGTADGRHSSLAIFADVDNDGDLDMFSGLHVHRPEDYEDVGDRNDLFLNDGSGHFTLTPDMTFHEDGILNTAAAVFLDYDLDGNIDLFIGNWWKNWKAGISFSDELYRGNGDGSFTKVTDSAGLQLEQPTYATTATDWNNDGYLDIFAGNYCQDPSLHWFNNGDGTFSEYQDTSNFGQYTHCSWGAMPRDFDNDGDIDLFEIIVHGEPTGLRSSVLINSDNVFTWNWGMVNRRPHGHWEYGDHYACWFDIENDGLSDLVLTDCAYGTSENQLIYILRQGSDHTLEDVTEDAGLGGVRAPHPVVNFDYDRDGDEDLIIGLYGQNDSIQVWRNNRGTSNNWITVKLEGAGIPGKSNTCAIGARVELTAGGVTYTREVSAGNGHFGPQAPLSLTFGLGQATYVDSIKVYWPNSDHTITELNNIPVNRFLVIREAPEKFIVVGTDDQSTTGAGNILLYGFDPSLPNPFVYRPIVVESFPGGTVQGLDIFDYERDGDFDFIALVRFETSPGSDNWKYELHFFKNEGCSFTKEAIDFSPPDVQGAWRSSLTDTTAADFNNDTYVDFVVSIPSGLSTLTNIYEFRNLNSQSTPFFDPIGSFSSPGSMNLRRMDAANFDVNNINADFMIVDYVSGGNFQGDIYLYSGNGDFTFTSSVAVTTEKSVHTIAAGHFDSDAWPDIIVGGDDDGDPGQYWYYRNTGTGSFLSPVEVFDLGPDEAGSDMPGAGVADAYDFDNDLKMDVVATASEVPLGSTTLYFIRRIGNAGGGSSVFNLYAIDIIDSLDYGYATSIAAPMTTRFGGSKAVSIPGVHSIFNLRYNLVELYICVNKEACSNMIYNIEIFPQAQQPRWDSVEAIEAPEGWSFEKIGNGVRFYTETSPLLTHQRVKFTFRVKAERISWYMRIHATDRAHQSMGMKVSTRPWLYYFYLM
ncbi:MAG: hypothetical protein AYK19_19025 [Theionarchaea archaeon DG-70-1]|nr:MAG: hypothetical protein AYK19_19025 [Theionarchaea archaeon DG-70-1]